jgi:hypothetical protein
MFVTVACVVACVTVALPGVAAQDDPGDPVNIYGSVADETGTPAPVGTTINAVVDGEVEDSLTVDDAGSFGGPDAFAERLVVNTGAGETVTFTVAGMTGPTAAETVALGEAGSVVEVNLTFPAETFAESADLAGVSLLLGQTSIGVGSTTGAAVTANFTDDSQTDVTDVATVESLDPDVATVEEGAITAQSPGTATIQASYTVDGSKATDTVEVTVEAAGEPLFEVTGVDVPETTAPDEQFDVTVTVTNAGDAAGGVTVTHEFGGLETETTLDLAPGETESLPLSTVAPDEPGTFEHTVGTPDDSDTGVTTVESDDDPDNGQDDGDDSGNGEQNDDGEDSGDSEQDGDGADNGDDGDDNGDGGSDDGDSGDSGSDGGDSGTDDGDSGSDGGDSETDDGDSGSDGGDRGSDGGGDSGTDDGDSGSDGGDRGSDGGDSGTDDGDSGTNDGGNNSSGNGQDNGTDNDGTDDDDTGDDDTGADNDPDGGSDDGLGPGFGIAVAVCGLLGLLGVGLGRG